MGDSTKQASEIDAVLIAIAVAEEESVAIGRTAIQKILYFAARKGLVEDTFYPHYYGPYSDDVDSARVLLTDTIGLVVEEPPDSSASPKTGYKYKLSGGDTKKYVREVVETNEETATYMREVIAAAKKVGEGRLQPWRLAAAAKVHYILTAQNKPITLQEMQRYAHSLQWKCPKEDVEAGVRLLVELGLARSGDSYRIST